MFGLEKWETEVRSQWGLQLLPRAPISALGPGTGAEGSAGAVPRKPWIGYQGNVLPAEGGRARNGHDPKASRSVWTSLPGAEWDRWGVLSRARSWTS